MGYISSPDLPVTWYQDQSYDIEPGVPQSGIGSYGLCSLSTGETNVFSFFFSAPAKFA